MTNLRAGEFSVCKPVMCPVLPLHLLMILPACLQKTGAEKLCALRSIRPRVVRFQRCGCLISRTQADREGMTGCEPCRAHHAHAGVDEETSVAEPRIVPTQQRTLRLRAFLIDTFPAARCAI